MLGLLWVFRSSPNFVVHGARHYEPPDFRARLPFPRWAVSSAMSDENFPRADAAPQEQQH